MRKKPENSVGEPGQFKTTPVVGFTPTDHTPTEPALKKEKAFKKRGVTKSTSTSAQIAEREHLKRVPKHHKRGVTK
jgi:hypothetical protein